MRAFYVPKMGSGLESGKIGEVDSPELGADQVLIDVASSSLNPADVKVLGGDFAARFLHAKVAPLISGYDFAGTVAQSSGDAFKKGDEVWGFLPYDGKNKGGALAEQVVANIDAISHRSGDVSPVDAARAATAGITALQGLRDKLKVTSGQRVLINGGSGGVGIFAVQIAKHLGATVVATCSAAKADSVRDLGADEVVDYRTTPITALSGPFDAIFDAAATSSLGECVSIMSSNGRYLTTLPGLGLIAGKIRAAASSRACEIIVVTSVPADLQQLDAWLADGTVKVIGEVFSFDEVGEAFRRLDSGKVTGKVGIEIG